jgi:hypothetical protein
MQHGSSEPLRGNYSRNVERWGAERDTLRTHSNRRAESTLLPGTEVHDHLIRGKRQDCLEVHGGRLPLRIHPREERHQRRVRWPILVVTFALPTFLLRRFRRDLSGMNRQGTFNRNL